MRSMKELLYGNEAEGSILARQSEVAEILEVEPRVLAWWQGSQGALPRRPEGHWRVYRKADILRLMLVKALLPGGSVHQPVKGVMKLVEAVIPEEARVGELEPFAVLGVVDGKVVRCGEIGEAVVEVVTAAEEGRIAVLVSVKGLMEKFVTRVEELRGEEKALAGIGREVDLWNAE